MLTFVTLLLFLFGVNTHLQTFKSQSSIIVWCNYCEPVSSGQFLVDFNIFWYRKIAIKYVILGEKRFWDQFLTQRTDLNTLGFTSS